MPGPVPKKASVRQRRNKVATARELATEERRRYAPRLPERADGSAWDRRTVAWWREVWHSPMAAEFLRSDVHGLYRLAELVEMFWREPSTKLASEIRLEQQAFGLTPMDRRRLQWSVDEEAGARPAAAAAATREQRAPVDVRALAEAQLDDPRSLLGVSS